jgi:DNA-3-methyladenine glycosylase II
VEQNSTASRVSGKGRIASLTQPEVFRRGLKHVRKDKKLSRLIDKHGKVELKTAGGIFESLVESILSQQLASAAANSIIRSLRSIYANGQLVPEALRKTPARKMRKAGVSPQKISYLKDLSAKVCKGEINLHNLRRKSDAEIIETLDAVRGIGPWTVQMLLIFTLGRPDVLPVDDLGIRKSVQKVYAMRNLPDRRTIERIAEQWHPYCTVASLYLWREKDGK